MTKLRSILLALVATATVLTGTAASTGSAAADAEGPHYYILIAGTCDGHHSTVYDGLDLRGGIPIKVPYPAGASGLPGCDQTPMDQSVAIGHESARQKIMENWDPGATYTVVGYSQGAVVANKVLNDIADGRLPVDKSRFSAKLYSDPMQPVGPPGRGISAVIPAGWGAPSPFGGYVSFGPGRTDFGGIPYIRYCIETDGVCHFDTIESAGGYFAQHRCYQWRRPDGGSIMNDTIADGVFTNASQPLPRQNCKPPFPAP